jgi:uncharacterized spore protein YtfJ
MDIAEMATGVREALTVARVFGQPYERDGVMVVPVAALRGGAGGGSSETEESDGKEQEGEGGGFALAARPVGVYVINGDKVRWEPAVDLTRVIVGGQVLGAVALLVLRQLVKRALPRPAKRRRRRHRR